MGQGIVELPSLLRAIARDYYHRISNQVGPLNEGGFVASLLLWAIEDGKIEAPPPEDLGLLLKKLRRKKKQLGYSFYLTWRKEMKLDKSDHASLSRFLTLLYIDRFARIERDDRGHPIYNIIGAPDGADVDLMVKVTSQNPIFPPDLKEALEYFKRYFFDKNEEDLDLILVSSSVETKGPSKGRVSWVTGKGKESINIGFHTYQHHIQAHPPFFTEKDLVLPQIHEQIFAIGKWIFDKMKKYLGKERYKEVVGIKKEIYNDFESRNRYGCELIKKEFDQNSQRRLWKSIVMKVSQLYIYIKNKRAQYDQRTYIKSGIAEVMGEHFPELKEHFLHSLVYRDHLDKMIPCWFKLRVMEVYRKISSQHFPTIKQADLIPVLLEENPTPVSDEIFEAWRKSPRKVTPVFAEKWLDEYGLTKIGLQFQEECKNTHLLTENFPTIHVDDTPQRSPRWMMLYNDVYITGRNTGVHDPPADASPIEVIIHHSNLIGGNMGESIAFSYLERIIGKIFPWHTILGIVTVGMISRGGPGTMAFSPDAMIVLDTPDGERKIIPVEIKTFQSKPEVNNTFLRGYSLARQQLLGAIRVSNDGVDTPVATQGLGVFLFINPEGEKLGEIHTHLYEFHPEEIHFPLD